MSTHWTTVRTQFWLGELMLHPAVRAELSRFRAGAGVRRLEHALRGETARSLDLNKSLARYKLGQRACRENSQLLRLADAKFAGSSRAFRSPLWLALRDTAPSRAEVEAQAQSSEWSTYWELAEADVDQLVHFDNVDALGCLLLHVALSTDRSNLGLFAHSHLVHLWFSKNMSAERLSLKHIRSVVALIREKFFGRLLLPADLTASPPSWFPLLDWA